MRFMHSFSLSAFFGLLLILMMTPKTRADFLTAVSYSRQVGVQVDRSQSGATDVSSVFSGSSIPANGSIYANGPVAGAYASANYSFSQSSNQASFQGTTNFNVIGGYSSYTEGFLYSGTNNTIQTVEINYFTLNQQANYSIQTAGTSTFNTSFPQGGEFFQLWSVNGSNPTVAVYNDWLNDGSLGTTSPVTGVLAAGNYYFLEYNYGSLYSGNLTTISGANMTGTTSFRFDLASVPEPNSLVLLATSSLVALCYFRRRRKQDSISGLEPRI